MRRTVRSSRRKLFNRTYKACKRTFHKLGKAVLCGGILTLSSIGNADRPARPTKLATNKISKVDVSKLPGMSLKDAKKLERCSLQPTYFLEKTGKYFMARMKLKKNGHNLTIQAFAVLKNVSQKNTVLFRKGNVYVFVWNGKALLSEVILHDLRMIHEKLTGKKN